MRHLKSEVDTIKNGVECGLAFGESLVLKEGDLVTCYAHNQVPQQSAWDPGFWIQMNFICKGQWCDFFMELLFPLSPYKLILRMNRLVLNCLSVCMRIIVVKVSYVKILVNSQKAKKLKINNSKVKKKAAWYVTCVK